jgi:hypothetical protein
MREIAWPTKPFYIMSKIRENNSQNWGLMVASPRTQFFGRLYALRMVDFAGSAGTIDQLWTATPDPRGGAILRHISSGQVLTCKLPSQTSTEGALTVMQPLKSPADPTQLFRVEDVGDNWVAINSLIQWESKINGYGSDVNGTIGMWRWDGGDNEKWRLVLP